MITKEVDYGFCYMTIVGFDWTFYEKKGGDKLSTPARADHTLTAVGKLVSVAKAGFDVDSKLLVQLAYAVRERRNRIKMGWTQSIPCKNTLKAVEAFIAKSYDKPDA